MLGDAGSVLWEVELSGSAASRAPQQRFPWTHMFPHHAVGAL